MECILDATMISGETLFKRFSTNHEDGFTLVELLVVILIIGILSAIAIPVFLNQRKTANDATVESDIKNIAIAIQTMPENAKRLAKLTTGTGDGTELTKVSYFSDNDLKTEGVPTSSGVWWTVTGDSSQYCIIGYHTNGKKYTKFKPLMYDSTAGGMGRTGTACNPEDILGEDGQVIATGNLIEDPLFANITRTTPTAGSLNRVESYFHTPWMVVDTETPVGSKAVEFTTSSNELSQGMIFLQSKTDQAEPILRGGEKWVASAYVKAPAGKSVSMGFRVVNVNSGYVGEYSQSYTATGGWDRISYTYTTEPGQIGYYPSIQVRENDKTPGQKLLIAGPMVERSPTLNPFRVG